MLIKASTDYGLRAVLYLARENTMCSSKDIAEEMSIPRDYFIQLAQLLRSAGIIDAKAGKHGGYFLARPPQDITLLQVIEAIDADVKASTLERREDRRDAPLVSGLRQVYDLIMESFDAYLDSITIEMLLECSTNVDSAEAYLAERLAEESERLGL